MKKGLCASLLSFIMIYFLLKMKKPHCVICGDVAILKLSKNRYICENCANSMNDIGIEKDS